MSLMPKYQDWDTGCPKSQTKFTAK